MRVPHLSPLAYRRITIVAAVLLGIIIVTGAAVRLTSSGLGCPVGVSCPQSQLQAHGPASEHATIEHLNRLFTGLVSVAVILSVLGSLVRTPRRRDLVWLSWGLVAGVFAQAVLGQLTVAFDLKPGFVMAHFLVSILLLTDALVLVRRSGQPDGPAHAIVSARTVLLGRVLVGLATLVLFTGTVVTGAGPHSGGGKHQNVARLDIKLENAARIHSGLVWIFLAAVLVMVWLLRRDRASRGMQQRITVLLVLIVAQGAIGYIQYFNDIPAFLVGIHVAGAALVWTATMMLLLGMYEHEPMKASAGHDDTPLLARA
ncbi:MAG TPA: COX15/CtaA family protein [Acidimicrobiia bacterium]|nr:COX15/CtaA family protein [Acidimicrobiia bacterium]